MQKRKWKRYSGREEAGCGEEATQLQQSGKASVRWVPLGRHLKDENAPVMQKIGERENQKPETKYKDQEAGQCL